jgi:nucleoside-diphosphate kinase
MLEQTLSILKPDAVAAGHIGAILSRFESAGLRIAACRMVWLSRAKAREFYVVHKERPFFNSLVDYMVSGPVVVSVLEGKDAIAHHRKVLGATNPAEAVAGTVRKDFGTSIEQNAAHGSDGPETARVEIAHFFAGLDRF